MIAFRNDAGPRGDKIIRRRGRGGKTGSKRTCWSAKKAVSVVQWSPNRERKAPPPLSFAPPRRPGVKRTACPYLPVLAQEIRGAMEGSSPDNLNRHESQQSRSQMTNSATGPKEGMLSKPLVCLGLLDRSCPWLPLADWKQIGGRLEAPPVAARWGPPQTSASPTKDEVATTLMSDPKRH
ncbi:hypothetical protein GQ53DRAFT_426900 [Thozetella sp. PMI_491]|nr:hypothetical protein GQ53DRAFT_426900 [Thozetella sp. PMI_491]